ncbi:hypothetical protein ACPWT1_04270 [Ramlibacter sp. MMS24-I3-19]|uniref:hypothetical protein n=1 Tax=Ramlibacter sp. MMS24-I3-19 TaxID=3416606 RepID=UPI003D04C446
MRTKTMSLLLVGLLGAATAWAETPPTATTDVPVGGQASTMTQGRPNMATTNNPAVENPSAVGTMGASGPMASDASSSTSAMGAAPAPVAAEVTPSYGASSSDASSSYDASSTGAMGAAAPVPQDHMRRSWFNSDPRLGTGEESTMVNGQPNANPDDPLLSMTREERRAEREFKQADARTRREQAIMGSRSAPEPWQQPGGTPE